MSELNIAILGAGVVGLNTALELKNEFRNASLHMIADKFETETTSFVAAGIFRPTSGSFGNTESITRKWIVDSYNYWDNLRLSAVASEAGVKQISGYIFSSQYPHIVRNKFLEKIVPVYRQATEDELKICPGNWKYGSYFSTTLTDPTRYLRFALNKLKDSGVKICHQNIQAFQELDINYDVIINCTGLGAKLLCQDSAIVPLRGQVSKVDAPWIKNFFYGDYDTYVIPSFDNVTLGGCRQYESYDLNMNHYDYLAMKDRCEKLVPSLKKAKLIGHKVGLRPHRIPVRVEKEYLTIGGREMKIVHNYGHGGYGVTTSPGTALNTVQLVKELWVGKKSKL